MPTVNLGKVGMTLKGVYDNEVQYEKLDVVYYDDSTYCAKVNTQGNLPTDETYWQLLVAPNPLATWKPNTKDDEGYVEKGDGHTDSLWATDSNGNPAWVKKEDVATKVETNSKTADGIVTKGQDSPDKVWATDSEGNPAWRELDSGIKPNAILDTLDWESSKYSSQYVRYFAKIEFSETVKSQTNVFEGLRFYIFSNTGHLSGSDTLLNAGFNFSSNGFYGNLNYYESRENSPLRYENTDRDQYISKIMLVIDSKNYVAYLGLRYNGNAKIYINNLSITGGIENISWIFDENQYLDLSTAYSSGFSLSVPAKATFDGLATNSKAGVAPILPVGASSRNYILGTYSDEGQTEAYWRTLSDLSLLTSTEIQEAISTAIANADFSSFEIVEIKPTPETAVENKFYLVKNEDTEHYDIYAKIGEQVEWIDDTTVDLTNYATKEELPTNVSELENDANYTSLTDEQYNTLLQLLG